MAFNPESFTSGHTLIRRLDEYNPWWETGRSETMSGEVSSLRLAFFQLYDSLHERDQQLVSVTGPDGAGKSTLLKHLISAHVDPDFIEKYFRVENQREGAHDNLVPPSNILYVPLCDDPVFQLQPEEQLRAAIDHFETHVLRPHKSSVHYLFFDDLHVVERPNKRGDQDVGRWERLLTELVEENDERRIVFTALSRETVQARLMTESSEEPNQDLSREHFDLYPPGLADFLRMRYRDIELAPTDERFDEGLVRDALRNAVIKRELDEFVSELEAQETASVIKASTARREIANYCTTGGTVAHRISKAGISLNEEQFIDTIRGRSDSKLEAFQLETLADFRADLLRAATNLGGVKDASGLERLCALTAHEHPIDDVTFDELTAVLDVDRRTLRNKYFSTLSRLHTLSAAPEYDNQRPRKVRFYLRDPGITNAFGRNDLNDVLRRQPGLDEALAKAVAFDHTIRLSNSLNDPNDPKRGVVKFWTGTSGSVDFILKINGIPIPILWSYNRGLDELYRSTDTPDFDALQEYLEGKMYETERDRVDDLAFNSVPGFFADQRREYVQQNEYAGHLSDDNTVVFDSEPPFGIVLTNARVALEQGSSVIENGAKPIIQIPLWTYLRFAR